MICPVCHLELTHLEFRKFIKMIDGPQGPIEIEALEASCTDRHSTVRTRNEEVFGYSLKLDDKMSFWIMAGSVGTYLYRPRPNYQANGFERMIFVPQFIPFKLNGNVIDTASLIDKVKKLIVFS